MELELTPNLGVVPTSRPDALEPRAINAARPDLSVVVPTFNRRQSLLRLIESLSSQTCPADRFEVVVVDDGSTDGTAAAVRAAATPFSLRVVSQFNGGPAEARNRGVRLARGHVVVFLDDDVVPSPHLLATHAAAHQQRDDTVVIGPMLRPDNWRPAPWIRWEEDLLRKQYAELIAGKYACTPRQFYTGNASVSRERFLATGGFDPQFRRAEDVELAYRLHARGARFAFNPGAHVLHYPSRSFASWSATPYQYGRYDVVMHREKGLDTLGCTAFEFHNRHPLTRLLVRACLGRNRQTRSAIALLRMASTTAASIGAHGLSRIALSGIHNIRYWEGVADEMGGAAPARRFIAAARVSA